MPRHSEQIVIAHSSENLFELVKDIRRYPEFIRWINTMNVQNEELGETTYSCVGTAKVSFKGFSETFSTKVVASRQDNVIAVSLKDGPFRRLNNRWRFEEIGQNKTRIHFQIDYEFKNFVLGLLARANTKLAIDRIMSAFKSEADRRYAVKS